MTCEKTLGGLSYHWNYERKRTENRFFVPRGDGEKMHIIVLKQTQRSKNCCTKGYENLIRSVIAVVDVNEGFVTGAFLWLPVQNYNHSEEKGYKGLLQRLRVCVSFLLPERNGYGIRVCRIPTDGRESGKNPVCTRKKLKRLSPEETSAAPGAIRGSRLGAPARNLVYSSPVWIVV